MTDALAAQNDDVEEAACRLLLFWSGEPPPAGSASLAGIVAAAEYARVAIAHAAEAGVASFIIDDVDAAARLGATGIVVHDEANIETARRRLGEDAVIGAFCGTSKHAAMVAGEAGADYLLLGDLPGDDRAGDIEELVVAISWCRDLIVLPVAAIGVRSVIEAEKAVLAGADFLCPAVGIDEETLSRIDALLSRSLSE